VRIVQVVPSMEQEASGPTYSVSMLAQALAVSGDEVDLFSVRGCELPLDPRVTQKRFRRDFQGLPLLGDLCLSAGMRAELNKVASQADIVHSHGLWLMPTVYPGWAAIRANKPLIISPRGTFSRVALERSALKKRVFRALLQNRVLHAAKVLHATSRAEFEDIRSAGLSQPVAIIPNGVDVPPLTEGPVRPRSRRLLYLGRIHPIKGLDVLLGAWKSLEARFPDWTLRLAGPDGGHEAALREMAARSGLKRIEFAGPRYGADKVAEYQDAALYVLPSHTENFGMTVAEALASGTPVITTEGTPWSGLADKRCGWWIKLDVPTLSGALQEAMSLTDSQRAAMGLRGRQWMVDDFSWAQVAEEMRQVYRWTVNGGPEPRSIHHDR
jgi:glycosyltransferase involved in cell wall biosynthesis